MCATHYQRWRRNGDPVTSNVRRGPDHYAWTGDAATYSAVHQRIYAERGLARKQRCRYCAEPAQGWAYIYGDPAEQRGDDGHGNVLAYSTDLSYYISLCHPCHRRLDASHLPVIEGVAA